MRMSLAAGAFLLLAAPAVASETLSYSYDALGRLVKVQRSGSVNDGVTADYSYDAADNRSNVAVSGSTFGSSTRVVVVPLKGMTVIPLGRANGSGL